MDALGHVEREQEGNPTAMHRRGRIVFAYGLLCAVLSGLAGCAAMRRNAPSPDLRPCTDGYAYTEDGWRLGVRHYRPEHPDPGKLPVILCHGLGLNATFWTITERPSSLPVDRPGLRGFRLRHSRLGRKRPVWAGTIESTECCARPS